VVWLVALVQLVNILDFMMVMPLGPDFSLALGFPQSNVGVIAGAYTGAAAVSGLIGAQFLDRFDRRSALSLSLIGLALGTALGGLAVDLNTMIGARVVAGIFGGPATALSLAIVADVVPPVRRGRAMAIVMSGFSVASVLGIPAGLMLARAGSWRTPFLAIGGLALLATVVTATKLPSLRGHLEKVPGARVHAGAMLRRPELVLALATYACLMLSLFSLIPNLSAYFQYNMGFPRDRIELLYMAGGVCSFAALMFAGRAVDRLGAIPVASIGVVFMVTSTALGFAIEPALLPVPVVFVLFMSSGSLRSVSISTLVSRLPSPSERAQYMSLQSAVQHIASAVAAVVSSQMLTTAPDHRLVGMSTVAIAAIVLALAVPVFMWRIQVIVARRAPQAEGAVPVIADHPT
jgi:predicted MFS family arabinose efflux permease